MTTTENILVIFLSTALAIFLTVAIILTFQGIRLVKTLQRIADKAESAVKKAEHVGEILQNVSGPLGVLNMIKNIAKVVNQKKGGKS